MLQGMGFSENRCQKALLATGNSDGEAAMEWLFQHMDDPGPSLLSSPMRRLIMLASDIDAPVRQGGTASAKVPEPSADQIATLVEFGFGEAQARKALQETVRSARFPTGNVSWLFPAERRRRTRR
jgi:ubiquitin carboxyl-terminal hydrolase 5/13